MNEFTGVVQMQVDTLLETLRRQQAMRCQKIASAAEKRAGELIKAAHRKSRDRMRQAVLQERQRIDAALSQARGRMRTRERKQLQLHYQGLLEEGWAAVADSLRARWANSGQRRAWCEALLGDARDAFGAASVLIEHPPDWPKKEQAWLAQALRPETGGKEVAFSPDKDIACGLRIRTATACLDGTLDGLLDDRRGVEAILLAAWEKMAAESGEETPADAGRGADHV